MSSEVKRMSVLDQLKKLDEQRSSLLAGAKKEALDKAKAAVDELNTLGFSYSLVEGDGKRKRQTRVIDPNAECPVCKFATIPSHNGRQHRSQDPKKPFTAKELEELGMKKKA
jgi:hypothetical protein